MKKILTVILCCIVVVLSSGLVFAEDETTSQDTQSVDFIPYDHPFISLRASEHEVEDAQCETAMYVADMEHHAQMYHNYAVVASSAILGVSAIICASILKPKKNNNTQKEQA